jgi:hypothetical protein
MQKQKKSFNKNVFPETTKFSPEIMANDVFELVSGERLKNNERIFRFERLLNFLNK